jgi:hypothetical protein
MRPSEINDTITLPTGIPPGDCNTSPETLPSGGAWFCTDKGEICAAIADMSKNQDSGKNAKRIQGSTLTAGK